MYFNKLPALENYIETKCPDIDLQIEYNAEATLDGESERRLRNGYGTDIITTTLPLGDVSRYVSDLSAESYASKYQSSIMRSLQIKGKTCFIPLPGLYYGYVYNTTLADRGGIAEAASQSELIAMLSKAKEQNLGVGSDGTLFGLPSTLSTVSNYFIGTTVPDFLALPEGILWIQDIKDHKGTFSGTMTHCLDQALALCDRGYLNPTELSGVGNETPLYERMLNGTMFMTYQNTKFLNILNNSDNEYEYAMIPFLSDQGNPSWTISTPEAYLAINKVLDEKGNEEKLEACQRIFSLLSTEEGQEIFISDNGAAKSYLIEYHADNARIPGGIGSCIENDYVYDLRISPNLLIYFGREMSDVLIGNLEMNEALAAVDDYFENGSETIEYDHKLIGVVASDLIYENYNVRREETCLGNLIADAVREMTNSDFSFVNGGAIRGSFYKGNVFGYDLDTVCPYPNKLVVLNADAATIRSMLENGISEIIRDNPVPSGRFLNVSGLCYSFEPPTDTNPAKLLDVTLPDGSPLDDDRQYTITVTDYMAGSSGYLDNNGDGYTMLNVFSDTAPLAENVTLVKKTDNTYADALQLYFTNHNDEAIEAKIEGRIQVVENGANEEK